MSFVFSSHVLFVFSVINDSMTVIIIITIIQPLYIYIYIYIYIYRTFQNITTKCSQQNSNDKDTHKNIN